MTRQGTTIGSDATVAATVGPSRRAVVAGVAGVTAAGLATAGLSGCGGSSGSSPAGSDQAGAAGSGQAGNGGSAPAGPLAKTADVPVGGGLILKEAKLVITQPTAGSYVGLSSICTHAGCPVTEIQDQAIVCPCHRSEFNLDGTVRTGPATQPLPKVALTVSGDSVSRA